MKTLLAIVLCTVSSAALAGPYTDMLNSTNLNFLARILPQKTPGVFTYQKSGLISSKTVTKGGVTYTVNTYNATLSKNGKTYTGTYTVSTPAP